MSGAPPVEKAAPDFRLARSVGAAGAATLASRILGLARDQVLATLFGAGNDMDAFIVAFRVPNLARDLFADGAMSSALVPTFTRHLTLHGKTDAWRLANNVLTMLLLVTGTVVAIGIVLAPQFVATYAPTFAEVPGKIELTVRMTRVVMPFLVMVAVAAAMMGMLNSLHHYFVPTLAPAAFNVATIVGVLALVPVMRWLGWAPIMAVAISSVAGGLAQIAAQWMPLRREGFRYRVRLDPRDPGLRQVLLLMGPGTIGLAATQINILVSTLLATGQGTGAVSWMTYAFRLVYLPIGLFGVSIATALLPAVSRHAAREDDEAIRTTVSRGIGLMLMLNVPATLGLIVLATPIVRLLFEHGRFVAADTAPTAAALRFYAVGLIGYSGARIVSPTFYALGQSRLPAVVSVGSIAGNIVLSVLLVRWLGFRGLPLGTSLAALGHGVTLVLLLRRRLGGIHGRQLAVTLVKVTLAGIVMAGVALGVEHGAALIVTSSSLLVQTMRLGLAIVCGLVALALLARLLRIKEFGESLAFVRSRMVRSDGGPW